MAQFSVVHYLPHSGSLIVKGGAQLYELRSMVRAPHWRQGVNGTISEVRFSENKVKQGISLVASRAI